MCIVYAPTNKNSTEGMQECVLIAKCFAVDCRDTLMFYDMKIKQYVDFKAIFYMYLY